MSSFGDDPIKDLGFVVFPASAGLDQRDCLFCAFSLHLWKMANFDESQNPVAYSNAWLDEVHRMLLMMGRDYLSQSPVPVFEEHESGRFGVMSAPLAQLLFRGSLNKELGRISD